MSAAPAVPAGHPPIAAVLRHHNGAGALFASVEAAVAQARHDASQPGHLDPVDVLHPDAFEHLQNEIGWRDVPSEKRLVLVSGRELLSAPCDCVECLWQRHAGPLDPLGREALAKDLGVIKASELYRLDPASADRFRERGWKVTSDGLVISHPQVAGGSQPAAGWTITFTAVALVAATAKTVMGIAAGANTPVQAVEWSAGCDGTTGSLLLEIVFGTNATNPPGTASTSFTPLSVRGPAQTVQAAAAVTWTTEPTVLTVVKRFRLPLPTSPYLHDAPLGREVNSVIAAATSGKFIGVRLTASSAVTNSDGFFEIEE